MFEPKIFCREVLRIIVTILQLDQDQIFEKLARTKYPGLDVEIPALGMTVEL